MAINLLDRHTAELIAAGEVVERPASVVKELCENAIDAGASHITVQIERGGIELIEVADDGAGIAREDLPLVFVRHATSKVKTAEDLDGIQTLGFRGEALASIASVARVRLLTKNVDEELAYSHTIEGGEDGETEDAARPSGTTITVRDLFYNTPARMKFLKKDASEGTFVSETVTRLALSHPEVAFRFVRDSKQVFSTPGDGEVRSAVFTVLGSGFAKDLVEVDAADKAMWVHGFVTGPRAGRGSRGMQYFFVNGRFVKNRTMMAGLEQAYRGLSMQGKFPGGVLFLHMPPQLVDVNVHPAKTEVRFAHEQEVFGAVYRAVKDALHASSGQYGQLGLGPAAAAALVPMQGQVAETPEREIYRPAPVPPLPDGLTGSLASDGDVIPYETAQRLPPLARGAERWLDISADEADMQGAQDISPPAQQSLVPEEEAVAPSLTLVGEVFKTYIVAQAGDTLCFIDKHAAHERILYEKIAAGRDGADSQQLVAPLTVTLAAAEKVALLENLDTLRQAGFEVEDFGGNAVVVRGVPADITQADVEGLITEIASRMAVNAKDSLDEKTTWVLHSIACRAAVKAGDHTAPEELLRLAEDILTGKVPPFCPHGRPVVLTLTNKELEKQFGRLG